MNKEEIKNELGMTYEELQCYLVEKYGSAKYDYFHTTECKSKNKKITRTSEGLYCHHMDEDKGGNLGNPVQAATQPFAWQRKERLVYCNILEHLILHIKIAVLRQKKMFDTPRNIADFFTTGGIYWICEIINDMFMSDGTNVAWMKRCYEEIRENYEDYILLIKSLMNYIELSYQGDKEPPFLVPGSWVHFSDCDCEIIKVSRKKDGILLRLPSGDEKSMISSLVSGQFTYKDQFDITMRKLSSGYESFYTQIYENIIEFDNKKKIEEYRNLIRIDFHGYGFLQYADIALDKSFEASNADEYISKALPMFCGKNIELSGTSPTFWRGKKVPRAVQKSFYIIRIRTSFSLKKGMEPCIRYRGRNRLVEENPFLIDDNHNLRDKGWTILTTSFFKKDINGKEIDGIVTVSLGKDDYLRFRERYDIRYLEVVDGCYFC